MSVLSCWFFFSFFSRPIALEREPTVFADFFAFVFVVDVDVDAVVAFIVPAKTKPDLMAAQMIHALCGAPHTDTHTPTRTHSTSYKSGKVPNVRPGGFRRGEGEGFDGRAEGREEDM